MLLSPKEKGRKMVPDVLCRKCRALEGPEMQRAHCIHGVFSEVFSLDFAFFKKTIQVQKHL